VKADPSKKGKLTKRDREELRRRETQQVRKFIEEIRLAALSDKEAFREKKMATAKITMLPRVIKELTNVSVFIKPIPRSFHCRIRSRS
jgi:hypothetical protein